MSDIDHKKIAFLAAKRAISEISISSSISDQDREIIFNELDKISKGLNGLNIKNSDNWLPLGLYDIGTQFND